MAKPTSQPVVPPQPSLAFYGLQELALFKLYTRDTYRAAFGAEAPPYDAKKLTKTWFDSTADLSQPDNVSVYKVVSRGSNGNWAVRQLVIPSAEAAAVNLPGSARYPSYVVAPTMATRTAPGDLTPQPVNPDYLSTHAQALALMYDVNGTAVVEEAAMGGGFGISYPADETRRLWQVVFGGRNVNVGLLLKNRNAAGVGAPGRWELTGEEPAWIADPAPPTGADDPRPLRELPLRDLLPNEVLQTTLMGVGVARTDLTQAAAKDAGQFTADDRAMLLAIYQSLISK